jgi:hypothetical protein
MDLFTLRETGQLLRALEKMLQDNVEDRLVTIMDEWRGMDRYPETPETVEKVTAARTKGQRMRHGNWFLSLLEKQTPQADAWIKYMWACVQDVMVFDAILDLNLSFREQVVMKIATLAEIYFDRIIVQEVEDRLRREALKTCFDEQLSCMLNDMLRILASSSVSSMSQVRDSDVDTNLDSDLD